MKRNKRTIQLIQAFITWHHEDIEIEASQVAREVQRQLDPSGLSPIDVKENSVQNIEAQTRGLLHKHFGPCALDDFQQLKMFEAPEDLQERYSVKRQNRSVYVRLDYLTKVEGYEVSERFIKQGESFIKHGLVLKKHINHLDDSGHYDESDEPMVS